MTKQKFDSKTTKKLISTYKNTISYYTAENEMLTSQLQDLKTTLSLNQNLLYDFINQYKREDETKVNNEDETKVNNENEKEKTIKKEINNVISNITHYCGSLYQNTNLNSESQNSRCLGYCYEFLYTKLQETMKIFNIPNSDYTNIVKNDNI